MSHALYTGALTCEIEICWFQSVDDYIPVRSFFGSVVLVGTF